MSAPVRNEQRARRATTGFKAWYERLFGRPADNLPMEGPLVDGA